MKLAQARRVADGLKSKLSDACSRIAIAGSVRRGEPEVNDIEIVCVPHLSTNLFDEPDTSVPHEVQRELEKLDVKPRLNKLGHRIGWGPRAFFGLTCVWTGGAMVKLDVFCVMPPAQWGAIFAIRTGPAEYSKWLVTRARKLGMRCEDGRLIYAATGEEVRRSGHPNRPHTEADFFAELELDWVPPAERRVP